MHCILMPVGEEPATPFPDLEIALETLLTVGHDLDDYDDDYVRRYAGPIRAKDGGEIVGHVELWCVDGSRAMENGFDIVDICDSIGQREFEYASAVYTDGTIDATIVEAPVYNDVLAVHELTVESRYRDLGIEKQVIRKITATIGYHTAAIIMDNNLANTIDLESIPAKSFALRAVVDF